MHSSVNVSKVDQIVEGLYNMRPRRCYLLRPGFVAKSWHIPANGFIFRIVSYRKFSIESTGYSHGTGITWIFQKVFVNKENKLIGENACTL